MIRSPSLTVVSESCNRGLRASPATARRNETLDGKPAGVMGNSKAYLATVVGEKPKTTASCDCGATLIRYSLFPSSTPVRANCCSSSSATLPATSPPSLEAIVKSAYSVRSICINAGTGDRLRRVRGNDERAPTTTLPKFNSSSAISTSGEIASARIPALMGRPQRMAATRLASMVCDTKLMISTVTSTDSPTRTQPRMGLMLKPVAGFSKANTASTCPVFLTKNCFSRATPAAIVPNAIILVVMIAFASANSARQESVLTGPPSTTADSTCLGWQPRVGAHSTSTWMLFLGAISA
mmetsp:Transcript_67269/g.184496  ORF Transcript_67269/g.184496 Transcript_67269/m.184496 type:complete len:296 (+) Transcript_67269:1034-1921(+)